MDINETKFHMLTGENDWEPILAQSDAEDLWWDRERQGLGLMPQILQYGQRSSETPLSLEDRRGAAVDLYGNIYSIDDNRQQINVTPGGMKEAGLFWHAHDLSTARPEESNKTFTADNSAATQEIPKLQGLAVTNQHYLVVGSLEPSGLLIFDLHAGGTPIWMQWPHGTEFSPLDICASADGGVWILDRKADSEDAVIWRLDRYMRLCSVNGGYRVLSEQYQQSFQPVNGEERVSGPVYIPQATILNSGSPIDVNNAIAIESPGDDSVLVLAESEDGEYSIIHRYLTGEEVNRIEMEGGILAHILAEPKILAHDFAVSPAPSTLPGTVNATLTLVGRDGNQAFSFSLFADGSDLDLAILPRYLPLRRFSGKGLLGTSGAVLYDMGMQWYPITEQPRRRYTASAEIDELVFDGKEPACVWHRIIIDGCIPRGSSIALYTRSDDDKQALAHLPWQQQPALVLRPCGSELTLHEPFSDTEKRIEGTGSWEVLIQNNSGRYLELKLAFSSDGRITPRLRALRIYYPRFSYVEKFLPSAYRENEISENFLERYLANTEGVFTELEQRISSFQNMLDTRTAPVEYLEWLATWLGASFNRQWDYARRRLFTDNAMLLFHWRGTQIGMRALLRLSLEPCPDESLFDELRAGISKTPIGGAGGASIRIIEHFLYRQLPGVVIGDPSGATSLRMTTASSNLAELGKPWTLNSRYQEFLRRRYSALTTEAQPYALALLNDAWHTDFDDFKEIVFSQKIPASTYQRPDWVLFVQRELATVGQWTPEQGVWALHIRYQEWLRKRYENEYGEGQALSVLNTNWQSTFTSIEEIRFSPLQPEHEYRAMDWQRFIREGLGFNYAAVSTEDTDSYRIFLARRYRHIDTLNKRYELLGEQAWSSFDDITLPELMPAQSTALADWIQFVSLTIPIRRNAHRFTVLVPTVPGEMPEVRSARMQQAEEVVRREKPAHTQFDVRLYWAVFQVGTARLGFDTTLGSGARYMAIVLGASYLGQGMLEYGHPWNLNQRQVIGRDRIRRTVQGENNNE